MARSTELLERSGQLAGLEGHLASVAASGKGRLVAIGGEAGVGKTELIRAFCRDAAGRPRVMTGACDALFTARPLGPFLDIAETEGGALTAVVTGGLPYQVVSALVAEIGRGRPAVVILEDLHWADEATLDVIRLLARRVEACPALVLVTYRDDELDRGHPLKILLGELPASLHRMRVPPLSAGAVGELAAGIGVDGEELYRKTGGNPFFVSEVLAEPDVRIPDTVRDAVLARAARLDGTATALLEAVAIAPPHAELWLLEELAPEAVDQLDRCLGLGILAADRDTVAFRHELARLAVEDALSPWRRVGLHRRALQALSDAAPQPDLARLAHHAEAAGDAAAVARYAPAAASRAAALGAHREAAAQYSRALSYGGPLDPRTRAELLERHSNECYLSDRGSEAIESGRAAVQAYHQLGDGLLEADALCKLSTIQRVSGHIGAAEQSLATALALLEDAPTGRELAMAYATTAQIAMCNGDARQTAAAGGRALELADGLNETGIRLHALVTIGTMETEAAAGAPEGWDTLLRGLQLAKDAGVEEQAGRAYNNLIHEGMRFRRFDLVDAWVSDAVDYCTERGLELWLHLALGARAERELNRAEWDAAAETARSVLEFPGTSVPRLSALTVLGLVRARRGDPDAWTPLDEALAIARPTGELQMMASVAAARAEAAWLDGDPAGVLRETAALVERAEAAHAEWAVWDLAYWRWLAGIRESIGAGDPSPRRRQIEGDAAGAAQEWTGLGCPYEAALALAETGEELLVRQALRELQRLGARPAAAVVARRLREGGARGLPRGPRATTAGNPAQLTRREVDVVRLVAEGLRDAEIAERLFVSEKTVGHHVSSVLRKLGVRTRGQAAVAATRLGVVTQLPK